MIPTPAPALVLRVIARSMNRNAFGLRSHILLAPTGEGWRVLRSANDWPHGHSVTIPRDEHARPLWRGLVECPERLPDAPPDVLREVFK